MQIAKYLIYKESLVPVIVITGNNGSLLAGLDGGRGVPVANPQSPPLEDCEALARFCTINSHQIIFVDTSV
jgi:hypothetical protein